MKLKGSAFQAKEAASVRKTKLSPSENKIHLESGQARLIDK